MPSIHIIQVDVDAKKCSSVVSKIPEEHSLASYRFNDGKCDPAGRLVVGVMNINWRDPEERKGRLYMYVHARNGAPLSQLCTPHTSGPPHHQQDPSAAGAS